MKYVLIVGQSFSTLTDYLLEHGHDYIVLKDVRRAKSPEKHFKRRVVCDFSSRDTVMQAVRGIRHPVDAVIATYENYILPAAWIAEELNLPGLPIATAEACTDKYLMRSLFAKAPEAISPDFAIVSDEQSLRDFAASHDFPLILKPANLAKSLLVTKNHSLDELIANYQRSMEQIHKVYERYAHNRTPSLIVEEFLEGSIHSVDAFTGSDGEPQVLQNVVDYRTGYDIGYEDNFHYSRLLPSKLSVSDQAALRHCATVGIRALGITNSPSHVEIIMTAKGPRIVEIGARNGGYRERMHKLANGIDITGAALALAFGETPSVTATKNESCAVLELFPKTPGNFGGLAEFEALKALPSLEYVSIKATPGTFVGKAADGHKMCAVVILHHQDSDQFSRDLTFVDNQVHVITT
jgi:biotin carboxylase